MQETTTTRELPKGWRWVKLGELCQRIDYGFTASADVSIKDPRFLRITDIQNGRVAWDAVPGCRISDAEVDQNSLADGDIVFARTGATTGKSFLIQNPPRSVFASYLIRLRVQHECDSEFLSQFFQGDEYWTQIRGKARGGAQPNFNATMLAALAVPLPPLAEQRRIAGVLREQMGAVARARAALEAQLAAAEALPPAHLRAVFQSPQAQRWPLVTVEDFIKRGILLEHQDGNHGELHPRNKDFVASGTRFVTAKHVSLDGVVAIDEAPFISNEQASGLRIGFASGGDVMLAHNATVGKVGIAREEAEAFVVGTSLTIFRANPKSIDSHFLFYSLRAEPFQAQLIDAMKQTTRNQVPITKQRGLVLPLPSLPEQRAIAARLATDLAAVTRLRLALADQLAAVERLPAALLRRAFAGEV